ncbi:MAG: ATP-binding domain-containing protein, partial [Chloroflexi bacterium]|nr:ATP-binding domain-containing protein [Chloroflexota bacterium]
GMPYKLVGATRFYERREIKDVLAYLRLIHNPYDNVSLSRVINVPPRRIGNKTIATLEYWANRLNVPLYTILQLLEGNSEETAANQTPVPDLKLGALPRKALLDFLALINELLVARKTQGLLQLLDTVLERTGYAEYVRDGTEEGEERWQNIMELRSVAQEYLDLEPELSLTMFLEEVALVSDVDNLNEEVDAPTLLTLHTAKGLEFHTVFIVGLEEGILPHSRSLEEPEGLEEERRLCYVGITRAKERLYLTHTFRRTLYGSRAVSEPSRFLSDIPDHLIQGHAKPLAKGLFPQEAPNYTQSAVWQNEPVTGSTKPLYSAGDQVRHAQFGDGIVVHSEISGGDEVVTVAFAGQGIKRLLLSFAPLEKLR